MLVKSALVFAAFAASAAHGHVGPNRSPRSMVMAMRAVPVKGPRPSSGGLGVKEARPSSGRFALRGGAKAPPALLRVAYAAQGLATSAAWTTVVWTTIRSNQPLGAVMPSATHAVFARAGALAAVPVIASCYAVLASASKTSWEELGSPTCKRLNLALVASGVGSALWVGFAPILTRIPGPIPFSVNQFGQVLGAHQAYRGATRAALIGAYASGAALSAGVWSRTLPEDLRGKPWTWPGRVADGVAASLVSLAPKSVDDPVNVKYSLLAASFALFTAVGFGPFPMAVMPSWTGRRCSRAFPAWTLLAAVSSYSLKEARESGMRLADSTYHTLSSGLTTFGGTYLAARVGAVFIDPSWPGHYKVVTAVIGYQAMAALAIGLTLRPDTAE